MTSILRAAAVFLSLFTLLTGIIYPLTVNGCAQVLFPTQANGSLLLMSGRVVGSQWIGQPFDEMQRFWSRPSATARVPYDAQASAGSNLGPTNPTLVAGIRARIAALRSAHPDQASTPVPADLVTASGSGLDPHISPAAAYYQVRRVAQARGLLESRVRALVMAHVEGRTFGVLGEPRVNVLLLNSALDRLAGSQVPEP